ncbi:hypothetical protein CAPTEDRAFT_214669 [Capitella teleta]|uniref:THAP-type domain-containing protein n=1 Tax=Capitella teleta TaxID=283909 RepID=R7UML7_CAPTE|nr:hypothetical protein CAPTEDRAFT_214669 [Capitella teleta]|eukprot:ELU05167.1 hypothetical protein CAPTEDRAFT_214669 [Capitella teleta]
MPNKCCVTGCKKNYAIGPKVSCFFFPSDKSEKKKWLRAVLRSDLKVTQNTWVCELLFLDSDLQRETTATDTKTGITTTAPLERPRLVKDAVPSQFPNLPFYFFLETTSHRPSPDDRASAMENEQLSLCALYNAEDSKLVKFVYTLSAKVLNPSSLEHQKVLLVTKLFNPYVFQALLTLGLEHNIPHFDDCSVFIIIMTSWWQIVNVKSPWKEQSLNSDYEKPLAASDCLSCRFLMHFIDWLGQWNAMNSNGKLTRETHSVISQTTSGLLKIANYCFANFNARFVLLGKFQTDSLEARFGQYRQLSQDGLPVLVYLAGYCVYSIYRKLKWESCKEGLTCADGDSANLRNSYIEGISRGGLLYLLEDDVRIVQVNYIVNTKLCSFQCATNQRACTVRTSLDILFDSDSLAFENTCNEHSCLE